MQSSTILIENSSFLWTQIATWIPAISIDLRPPSCNSHHLILKILSSFSIEESLKNHWRIIILYWRILIFHWRIIEESSFYSEESSFYSEESSFYSEESSFYSEESSFYSEESSHLYIKRTRPSSCPPSSSHDPVSTGCHFILLHYYLWFMIHDLWFIYCIIVL